MSEILPEEVGDKYAERVIGEVEEVETDEELNEFGLRGSLEPYDVMIDDLLTGDSL